MDRANDEVNHPSHYTKGSVECIDAMEAAFGPIVTAHFCVCSAFKYLWRHREKHENPKTDLEKAGWFINRAIAEYGKAGIIIDV